MAEKVSDKPWGQTKESDHDLEQWHRASLIHLYDGPPTSKEQGKLSGREPDGTLSFQPTYEELKHTSHLIPCFCSLSMVATTRLKVPGTMTYWSWNFSGP
ncbi:MAG: hypothetical protein PWQ91_1757 [Eubacteriales bacterium]|nr:hypothetical protein [Eubacteriales bacterium]